MTRRRPVMLAALALAAPPLAGCGGTATSSGAAPAQAPAAEDAAATPDSGTADLPFAVELDAPGPDPLRVRFKRPPRAALVFDLDTGRVLWRRQATRRLPIASLTKLMTALLVTERLEPGDRVPISRRALAYKGTGIGMLKRRMKPRADSLLAALLLFSANDAAFALAERIGGDVRGFVALMNERARELGMRCTRFSAPDGFRNSGNRSCPADLALLARRVMTVPRIAELVAKRSTVVPFPTKAGQLVVNSHNPLVRARYPGATGLKTGYTDLAGQCIVATARRAGIGLGVVLLDSPDAGKQAMQLLDRGFRAMRAQR